MKLNAKQLQETFKLFSQISQVTECINRVIYAQVSIKLNGSTVHSPKVIKNIPIDPEVLNETLITTRNRLINELADLGIQYTEENKND